MAERPNLREVTQHFLADDPTGVPGDCVRAAVASLLDREPTSVPHFIAGSDIDSRVWWYALKGWAATNGWTVTRRGLLPRQENVPLPTFGIACGPSEAFDDDPTIGRCRSFSQRAGYAGLTVVNLYSLRSTDPKALWTRSEADRIGPLGDQFVTEQAAGRSHVIAAWGTHGARNGRGDQVANMLADAGVTLHCLGVTKDGQPKHPLYLDSDTPFQTYRVREVCHA